MSFLLDRGLPEDIVLEGIIKRVGPEALSVLCALSKADHSYITSRQHILSSKSFGWCVRMSRCHAGLLLEEML